MKRRQIDQRDKFSIENVSNERNHAPKFIINMNRLKGIGTLSSHYTS